MATAPTILDDGQYLQAGSGDDAGMLILSTGQTNAEGLALNVIDEVVDLTAAGAKFVAMTTAVPADSVILSAQANIEELVVASGTTVKVALGLNASDTDKYGVSTDLTKNDKISTLPDYAVLSSAEQIDVCGVVTAGTSLGNGNFTAGKVRVRIVYLALTDLADA